MDDLYFDIGMLISLTSLLISTMANMRFKYINDKLTKEQKDFEVLYKKMTRMTKVMKSMLYLNFLGIGFLGYHLISIF